MQITIKKQKFVFKKKPATGENDLLSGTYFEDANFGVRIVYGTEPIAWVKDCRTGWAIPKSEATCLGKGKDGQYYWVRKGCKPVAGKTYASVWRGNELP